MTVFFTFSLRPVSEYHRHYWKERLENKDILANEQVIRQKWAKILLYKVAKFYRRWYGGGHKLGPHHTNICKILRLCRAIYYLRYFSTNRFQTRQMYSFYARGWGYSWELLVGVFRPVLQILTLFQTKKCHFPNSFSDQTSKIHTRFQTWPLRRSYVIIT